MASSIPYDIRQQIISLRESGKTFPQISQEVDYSLSGVKKIWYQYQKLGEACLLTQYKNCGKKRVYPQETLDAVTSIRTGAQGANYVYSMLKLKYPHLKRPSVRTIQYWWKAAETNNPKGRPSDTEKKMDRTSSPYLASRRQRISQLSRRFASKLDEYCRRRNWFSSKSGCSFL